MIKTACPHCDSVHKIPLRFAGKRVRCPSCGEGFRVPESPDAGGSDAIEEIEELELAAPPKKKPVAKAKPKSAPVDAEYDDEEDEEPEQPVRRRKKRKRVEPPDTKLTVFCMILGIMFMVYGLSTMGRVMEKAGLKRQRFGQQQPVRVAEVLWPEVAPNDVHQV